MCVYIINAINYGHKEKHEEMILRAFATHRYVTHYNIIDFIINSLFSLKIYLIYIPMYNT